MPVPFVSFAHSSPGYHLPQEEDVLFRSPIELCGYKYYISNETENLIYQGEKDFGNLLKRNFSFSLPLEQRQENGLTILVLGMEAIGSTQMRPAVYFQAPISDFLSQQCCQLMPTPSHWYEDDTCLN